MFAEALYGDESKLWVFDGQSGNVLLQAPRASITIVEYPVVSDVDNDGSAEILVVSNHGNQPTVQSFGETTRYPSSLAHRVSSLSSVSAEMS